MIFHNSNILKKKNGLSLPPGFMTGLPMNEHIQDGHPFESSMRSYPARHGGQMGRNGQLGLRL